MMSCLLTSSLSRAVYLPSRQATCVATHCYRILPPVPPMAREGGVRHLIDEGLRRQPIRTRHVPGALPCSDETEITEKMRHDATEHQWRTPSLTPSLLPHRI